MQGRNFNIVLPLDYLFGTLHWEPNAHDNRKSS